MWLHGVSGEYVDRGEKACNPGISFNRSLPRWILEPRRPARYMGGRAMQRPPVKLVAREACRPWGGSSLVLTEAAGL